MSEAPPPPGVQPLADAGPALSSGGAGLLAGAGEQAGAAAGGLGAAAERPEVGVAAAFGGGLVLAMILKRLGR